MPTTAIVVVLLLSSIAPVAGAQEFPVDLDQPGALENLERSNPSHYRRAALLINAAERARCESDELKRIRVQLDVAAMGCSELLLTSAPPKRRVTFTLDRTPYRALVTLRNADAKLIPAR
jgi:hypothetical protein